MAERFSSRSISKLGRAGALGACLVTTSALALDQTVVRFPKEVMPVGAGRIEFYARLTGYGATEPITTGLFGGGAYPTLLRNPDPLGSDLSMIFASNDGLGGGGLSARYDGAPASSAIPDGAATGAFFQTFTYGNVLGACVDCWHKYELRWNKDGLPGADNGQRKLAVYLDGILASAHFQSDPASTFPAWSRGELRLGDRDTQVIPDRGIVAFDEFRIFDGQDRLVLYNSLDSLDAVGNSVVGLGGTYLAGSFVPGAFGGAITQAVVPEAHTYALMLAGLALAGWFGRRRASDSKFRQ